MKWEALSALAVLIVPFVGWLFHLATNKAESARLELAGKLDGLAAHLARQDEAQGKMAERVARIEGKLDLRGGIPDPS